MEEQVDRIPTLEYKVTIWVTEVMDLDMRLNDSSARASHAWPMANDIVILKWLMATYLEGVVRPTNQNQRGQPSVMKPEMISS